MRAPLKGQWGGGSWREPKSALPGFRGFGELEQSQVPSACRNSLGGWGLGVRTLRVFSAASMIGQNFGVRAQEAKRPQSQHNFRPHPPAQAVELLTASF